MINPSELRPLTQTENGFDIIDESAKNIKKDKDHFNEKMRDLFNSVTITIEEKGYLI